MDRRILVVDDSEATCRRLSHMLARPGRQIKAAYDGTSALEWLVESNFSVVLVDLGLPGISGLDLIRELRRRDLPVTPIALTGTASIESAVEAMQLGSYDYILKPVDFDRLDFVVEKALEDRRLLDEVSALRQTLRERRGLHTLVGRSGAMRAVLDRVARAAKSDCVVLITGETGTGKELVAQALHDNGLTPDGPFVAVNCAAIPESLMESEFFGHEKGAFTGADRRKTGRFEQARGGTLFLDEIGEMPPNLQAKLLRVLQEGVFESVGSVEPIEVCCRILASTNIDLAAAVASRRFREDLYYRLNVVSIALPPLRLRLDDVPSLVEHALARLSARHPSKTIEPETLAKLSRYDWPGNVRQLEHVLEQMIVTTTGPALTPDSIPPQIVANREPPFSLDFDDAQPLRTVAATLVERVERAYLVRVLERYQGRIDRCAAHCGLSRRSISEKLRRHRIDKSKFKSTSRTRRPQPDATARAAIAGDDSASPSV